MVSAGTGQNDDDGGSETVEDFNAYSFAFHPFVLLLFGDEF